MQPWKFLLRKVPGLPGRGMPPKLSWVKKEDRDHQEDLNEHRSVNPKPLT